MSRVSLLVAAYNAELFIEETIRSVVTQTHNDWELIVVDDGSTDGTAGIVKQWAQNDSRIKLLRQFNKGASCARNYAFSQSTGDYIVILDADDCILPDKLESQCRHLDSNLIYGVVYGDTWHCDEKKSHIILESKKFPSQHVEGDIFEKIILGNIFAVHSAMVRRECVTHVGLHDESQDLIGDWDLWVRVAEHYRFLYDPNPVAEYRLHGGMSARSDSAKKQFLQRIGVAKKIVLMPRYSQINNRIKSLFVMSNARYAHKFMLYPDAARLYFEAFVKYPLNIKTLAGLALAILRVQY